MRLPRPQPPVAGRSAHHRFVTARRIWRRNLLRKAGPPLLAVTLILIALEVGRPNYHDWVLGLITGAVVALWADVSDAPPWYIEKWRRGAQGERRTARALRPLAKDGWLIRHDLSSDYGNRDHVLVGPPGVVLLDSKWFDGELNVVGDRLHAHRPADPRADWDVDLGPRMRGAAVKLNAELASAGAGAWVRAVVVVWGRFPQRVVEGDRVVFVHGTQLVHWLRSLPDALPDARRVRVADELARMPPAEAN